MSAFPPPQQGYGPPPPGYGPGPGYAPPRRKGNANGVLAAAVAGIVIVLGVVSTILLVTSDANSGVHAAVGSGSNRPTGSGQQSGQRPTGNRSAPTQLPTQRSSSGSNGNADLSFATSTGNNYFTDLRLHLYFTARSQWCVPSAFPLDQDDVDAVTSAYGSTTATGNAASAVMQGRVSLTDGRTGSLTITLRTSYSGSTTAWCITSQSNLQ